MHVSTRVRSAVLTAVSGVCAVALMTPAAASASSSAPLPEIVRATGGGGVPVLAGFTSFDLADVGYEQSEVFISGTATAYEAAVPDAGDGKVDAVAASTAPYTSRAVVVRPTDRRRFNGTVIVEWLNVSGGADAGPDWMLAHNELVRGDGPIVFATDADGNALGGIRTPSVDAPVATLTGKSTGGTSFCFLFGSTTPFTPDRLQELYPSHRAFVSAWTTATKSAQAAGFLVRADAKELIAAAKQSDIGK